MRVVVLADTHMRPSRPICLPDPVCRALDHADVVLHAGDVVTGDLLAELGRIAPTHAVLGNNDAELVGVLPETLQVTIEGVRVAMVHDSGPTAGREGRLRRRFPTADVVVFGHSHAPVDGEGLDGQRLFNPGSPTQRRLQPRPSFGLLDLEDGRVRRHQIVLV